MLEIGAISKEDCDGEAGYSKQSTRLIQPEGDCLQVADFESQLHFEDTRREELHQRLWPADTFTDFDHGLNNAVNRLREALCDSADKPRYVETLPPRGYGFMARMNSEDGVLRG